MVVLASVVVDVNGMRVLDVVVVDVIVSVVVAMGNVVVVAKGSRGCRYG